MSTYSDYKLYKQHLPEYAGWKRERDIQNAKRLEYLKKHPELRNKHDIQRAQSLLRAIDIMDEYSQKRAEDMEVATESVMSFVVSILTMAGMALGYYLSRFKPVENVIEKIVKPLERALKLNLTAGGAGKAVNMQFAGGIIGALILTAASFPMMAWATKTEISASRKGRFEAMDKELDNPNGFAVLTPKQIQEANEISKEIVLKEKSKLQTGLIDSWKTVKDMVSDSKEYKRQRNAFQLELEERENSSSEGLSPKEIEAAKRDKQLLTKIVEKIDIASQDYAENAELGTQTFMISIGALSGLLSLGLNKILSALKIKSAGKVSAITNILGVSAMLGTSIFASQIQKNASRIGRYKVKQELMKNPDELIYVDDEKASGIKDVSVPKQKKTSIIKFMQEIWKDNQEYQKYIKNNSKKEKKFYKATEAIKLSPEQLKEATTLQKNTFRTFNKIDENSQKYSESVEAIGQSVIMPISFLLSTIGGFLAPILAFKNVPKTQIEHANGWAKMVGIIIVSCIPTILMNAIVTREQKKASRVADMMAINELKDYREFRA